MNLTSKIEVSFPVPVLLPDDFQQRLIDMLSQVCKSYEAEHPDRDISIPRRKKSKVELLKMLLPSPSRYRLFTQRKINVRYLAAAGGVTPDWRGVR